MSCPSALAVPEPLERMAEQLLAQVHPRVPVLGLNGPQGAGKSTMAAALGARWAAKGRRLFALSIDDFYLPRADLDRLDAEDPLLAVRGGPGTHDVTLGAQVLDALAAGAPVSVPVFDKSLFGGRGDRLVPERWRRVDLRVDHRVDLVLFEGWMLGFSPLEHPPAALARANRRLGAYHAWTSRLDGLLQLRVGDGVVDQPATVVRWRVEAERRQAEQGRGAMSEAEAQRYVERFIPFYEHYPRALAESCSTRGSRVRGPHTVLWLGPDRSPLARP